MSLCLTCGMCCDGTLFNVAAVTPEEAARLEGRVNLTENRLRIRQPCPALNGDNTCAVYAERPHACRHFRCTVLQRLDRGELSEREAHDAIAEVLERRRVVAELVSAPRPQLAQGLAEERVRAGTASEELQDALAKLQRGLLILQLEL